MNKKLFALVDCNNFYVSCERVFAPHLQNKPVIVLSNNDGCIISRSQEVKQFGIKMAAPIFEYKSLVKEKNITLFSPNFTLYQDFSRRVMKILAEYTTKLEIYSVDEAFLTISSDQANLITFGKMIRERILTDIGIPVSIGIASTRTLAKAANELAKIIPSLEGVLNFEACDEATINTYLMKLPVRSIWGIGYKTAQKLALYHISNAKELKDKDEKWMHTHFSINGERTIMELRGISCTSISSITEARKSIISSRSFGIPVTDRIELEEAIATYIAQACEKLRSQHSVATYISIFLRTGHRDGQYAYSGFATLQAPSCYTPDFIYLAKRELKKIYKEKVSYKKAGIMLTGIMDAGSIQPDLFGTVTSSIEEKKRKMMKAVDTINQKWGNNTASFLIQGVEQKWRMKQALRSPRYTTHWDELLIVH